MFNKTAVFPKSPESSSNRGLRPGAGSSSSVMNDPSARGGNIDSLKQAEMAAASAAATSDAAALAGLQSADWAPSSGSRLIVGPDVKLKGAEILDCDTLVVEGRVEATMDSRIMRIAESGGYVGTVGVDIAEISGRFEGELTVRTQLLIRASGRVSGKIRYGRIVIEDGGEISGDVQGLPAGGERALRAPHLASATPGNATDMAS